MSEELKRTPWFPRETLPVRPGVYECAVRWTSAMRYPVVWKLEWDGKGFLVPIPMIVYHWRGLRCKSAPRSKP